MIGAPFDSQDGDNRGVACLFDGSGALLTTVRSPEPGLTVTIGIGFAIAALSDDTVVVSEPRGSGNHGAVHLIDTGSGAVVRTIESPTANGFGRFGSSLAIVGGNILIGAPYENIGESNSGAAFLFSPDGVLLHTFVSPNPTANSDFGKSVAEAGGNCLIGGKAEDGDVVASYLFDAVSGSFIHRFAPPPGSPVLFFGQSAAYVEMDVLVGAPYDTAAALDSRETTRDWRPRSTASRSCCKIAATSRAPSLRCGSRSR